MRKINWKVVAPVVAVLVVVVCATSFWMRFNNFIKGMDEYGGVKRSDTRTKVFYLKGAPTLVSDINVGTGKYYFTERSVLGLEFDFNTGSDDQPYALSMPEETSVEDYESWRYRRGVASETYFVTVDFEKSGNIKSMSCEGGYSNGCPPLMGVRVGDSEKDLVSRLGAPEWQKIDRTTKGIGYASYGAIFFLEKERVVSMTLLESRHDNVAVFKRYMSDIL